MDAHGLLRQAGRVLALFHMPCSCVGVAPDPSAAGDALCDREYELGSAAVRTLEPSGCVSVVVYSERNGATITLDALDDLVCLLLREGMRTRIAGRSRSTVS